MRHNVMLTKENSELLKQLGHALGLRPSAVVAQALHSLGREQINRNIRDRANAIETESEFKAFLRDMMYSTESKREKEAGR
jgi:aromatic ring-opening dioxygenase catalytic subunit (LigB family)